MERNGWKNHCSRHTFGSLQADAGTSIYAIQRMLGHKNVETTQIYADMSDETKKASVNRITLKSTTSPVPAPEEPVPVKVTSAESA